MTFGRTLQELTRLCGVKRCNLADALGLIRPITLWPYPVKAFETCKNAKAFMTVEINILGQMVDDVKLAVENKYPVGFYGTFFGLPEPEEIVAQAKAMLEKEGK